jgi:cell wall-associated NlpC family hydrolase
MVNRLIAAGLVALAITFSGTQVPASAAAIQLETKEVNQAILVGNTKTLFNNTQAVDKAINKLNKTVGKTWYVFSGSTPQGWDCSGLTMWFYEQVGVQLEHRASKQQSVGIRTKTPKVGDLVVFKYKGYNTAYHVGIYIGDGNMIHSPREGQRTEIEPVAKFAGNYSKVSYRQIVDTF